MATGTLGTSATTTLVSLNPWNSSSAIADVATLAESIKNDLVNGNPIYPGAFSPTGLLFVPNRGVLRVLPGDFVGVDPNGWPVLISKNSINGSGWTHNP